MKAVAVIVTYNPDLIILHNTVKVLHEQNIEIVIVDNSVDFKFDSIDFELIEIISNNENLGIAKAQNIGITFAIKKKADFICFFDQDSNIPKNFYRYMIYCRRPDIYSVFIPQVVDEDSGLELPTFKLSKLGIPQKIYSQSSADDFSVDLAISSGSVVTAKTFELVGHMNEDLFIDLVDFEWCFRCIKFKVPIVCVPQVKMKHSIGLRQGPITGMIHNPFRNYYKQRNPFYLLCYDHIPKMYSFRLILIALIQSFIMIVSQPESKLYLKSTSKAIFDGSKYFVKTLIRKFGWKR